MGKKKILVVGGGAAGFFAAIRIAEEHPDWSITIVEKSTKILSKVRISGGGRCNVTHACPDVEKLLQKYPRGNRFLKRAFYQFATLDTIKWFAANGISLHTEKDGRMFPTTNNSQTIIDCFLSKVSQLNIELLLQYEVVGIEKNEATFEVKFSNEKVLFADQICFAVGGIVKTTSFTWIEKLGHHFIEPVPSLFTFNVVEKNITSLMGLAVENASIQWQGEKYTEHGPLLITHWGISGPAAIKLSAWCARVIAEKNYEGAILINWVPEFNESSLRLEWMNYRQALGKREMGAKNPFELPQRLWQYLLAAADIAATTKWADLKSEQQQLLIQMLTKTSLGVKGKTTFKDEFVTCGGIDLAEIDANTMESKIMPGLHFAGEMMDVDGITGGFNFQHAWTSAWIAAKHMGVNA